MKKLLFSFLALGALMFTSCSSDPCEDKSATTLCTNNGTLVDNNGTCGCNCNAGYTGTNCNTIVLAKIAGDWTLSSSAVEGSDQNIRSGKTIISAANSGVTRVQITNLNQFFACTNGSSQTDVICYADINSAGEIVLDETAQCGYVFSGKGTIQSDGSIIFKYTAKDANKTYNCESTLTK